MNTQERINTILSLYAEGISVTQIAEKLHLPYSAVTEILEDKEIRKPKDEIDRQIIELYRKSYPISQISRYVRCTFNRAKQVIAGSGLMVQSDGHKCLPDRSNDMIYALEHSGYPAEEIAEKLNLNKLEVLHVVNKIL